MIWFGLLSALTAPRAAAADSGGCDLDGDGHDALFCDGDDCNDDDGMVYPGAAELPSDDIDQDCDGLDASAGVTWGGSGGSLLCGSAVGPIQGAWLVGAMAVVSRRRRRG